MTLSSDVLNAEKLNRGNTLVTPSFISKNRELLKPKTVCNRHLIFSICITVYTVT